MRLSVRAAPEPSWKADGRRRCVADTSRRPSPEDMVVGQGAMLPPAVAPYLLSQCGRAFSAPRICTVEAGCLARFISEPACAISLAPTSSPTTVVKLGAIAWQCGDRQRERACSAVRTARVSAVWRQRVPACGAQAARGYMRCATTGSKNHSMCLIKVNQRDSHCINLVIARGEGRAGVGCWSGCWGGALGARLAHLE